MKVLIRKTASGNEYWCTEEKRTLFVPVGEKPDFEVTENPKTMIGGVDFANGKDKTVIGGKVVDTINLDEMNIEQLYVSKRQAMRWRDDIVFATAEILGWR